MKVEIQRISPHRTALYAALVAGIMLVFYLAFFVFTMFSFFVHHGISWSPVLLMPLMYVVVSYVLAFAGCALYNALAPRIGGVELTLKNVVEP